MAKKHTLNSGLSSGYHLLGIVTHFKDYRLAYFLNDRLSFHLKKYDDLSLSEKGGAYSWYCYVDKENDSSVFLFANHHEKGKLVPAQKMDFFLLLKSSKVDLKLSEIVTTMRGIPEILAVFQLDMKTIKNMELILETVEMHELEHVLKPDKTRRSPRLSGLQ